MKILILGLGNPLLGDDGVGWRVAEEVEHRLAELLEISQQKGWTVISSEARNLYPAKQVKAIGAEISHRSAVRNDNLIEVDYSAGGGLSLMERLVGYDEAILIDAIDLKQGSIGAVYEFDLDELPNQFAGHIASAHETNLQMALSLGRSLGAALPDRVSVIALESPHVYEFSEELSSPIEAALPQAIDLVLQQLHLLQEA
jgi:hydrogenase maturation protease